MSIRALPLLAAAALPACTCDFELLSEGLPGAIFSVQGTGKDDVWLVGASATSGPAWEHWNGEAWSQVDTDLWAGVDLWWTWPDADEVLAVGSDGTILSLDRTTDEVTPVQGLRDQVTFFGVWGASAEDVWAVGGNVADSTALPALYRRQAGVWSEVDAGPAGTPGTWFKVHGTAADDVWIVGTLGGFHWDGFNWIDTQVPAEVEGLLTIHTGGPWPFAVGGSNQGKAIVWQDGAWRDVSPDFAPAINGVCASEEVVIAVGAQGAVYRWDGASFLADEGSQSFEDFHGCWVDGLGELWAVGGHISAQPLDEGIVGHEGDCGLVGP